jgi:hypothetical protein
MQHTIIESFFMSFHSFLHSSERVSSLSSTTLSVHRFGGFTKRVSHHQNSDFAFDGVFHVMISQTSESFFVGYMVALIFLRIEIKIHKPLF